MARQSKEGKEPWRAAVTELVGVIYEVGDIGEMEPRQRRETDFEREVACLDSFIASHNAVYDFSSLLDASRAATVAGDTLLTSRRPGTQDNPFMQLLQVLLEFRFLEGRWQQLESATHKLVVLQTLRILSRDRSLQRRFLNRGGGEELVNIFDDESNQHLSEPLQQPPGAQNPLVHAASMLAKLDGPFLMQCRRTLCCLLSTSERFLLQSVLASLHRLSASPLILSPHCQGLMQLPTGDGMTCGEKLLEILQSDKIKTDYRNIAAEIVLHLCQTEENRSVIVQLDGIKTLLGMVQNCSEHLLVLTLRIMEKLVEYDSRQALQQDAVRQTRTLGGINVVLSLLNRVNEQRNASPQAASCDMLRQQVLMACCALLAELGFDDDNSCLIRQLNGVFILTKVLVSAWPSPAPCEAVMGPTEDKEEEALSETAQVNVQALRALRVVFSLERNRRSFKRIFPPSIFERFIEIGQYQRQASKYHALAMQLARLPADKQGFMRKAVHDMRADLDSDRRVCNYLLLGEPIGKGSFGTIWRARMAGGGGADGPAHYALKEIPLEGGETEDDAQTHREVKLLSQMQHPNIVRYIDSFTDKAMAGGKEENRSLYIVMELVDGPSIAQLIASKSEKNERVAEHQVREILVALCHALYYMHKKKNITHRDLTPSNVLLTTEVDPLTKKKKDKPILVDFGLARQRQSDVSVMASVVGTLTYSCPELIERRPYTDKADIWSLGVILYQLLSLRNPFTDSNPLQTARKIVEGEIEAIRDPDNFYAPDLKRLIFRMMNPDTLARPDIIQVMEEINCWDKDLPQRDASRTDALDAAARPPQQRERRDPMDRCNDLYLETSLLQARIRTLEMEKERLESVVRAAAAARDIRDTQTRGGGGGARLSPLRARAGGERYICGGVMTPITPITPHTPGMGVPLTPHTPGSAYGRHFPQTPVGKSGGGQVRLSHFPQTPGGRTAGQTPAAKAARVGITGSSLRVPAAHVKEIDPASQMLNQLHKIVFVTQLPPDMGDGQANAQALQMRRAIEKYKRCLFGRYKTSGQGLNLKEELKKFLTNREEVIPLDFKDFNSAAGPSTTRPALEDKADGCRWDGKLTYHEMCNWIEVLLKENQYYESAAAELVVAPDVGLPEAVE